MKRTALGLMLASLLAFGCGDDSASDDARGNDGGTTATPGEEVRETIEAAEGGQVEANGAGVDIPAGALGENVEITIMVLDKQDLPDADNIASAVYDFGPDGTTFDEPVTLTIEFDASQTPDGMEAVMAWLDAESETWQPLADSEVSGDTVTATTDHFTPFAVIFTAGGQVAGSCGDIGPADCGGDLVGTWEFTLSCLTLPDDFLVDANGNDPFAMCGGATFSAVVDLTGTATFEADGSYAVSTMSSAEIVIAVPMECLPMGGTCSDLGDADTPAVAAGDNCELTMTSEDMNDETGTYEIDGNTLITTDSMTGMADEPDEYCVQGNTLTVHVVDPDGTETFLQATRQ